MVSEAAAYIHAVRDFVAIASSDEKSAITERITGK
jgi:hypothetical protein